MISLSTIQAIPTPSLILIAQIEKDYREFLDKIKAEIEPQEKL